MIPHTILPFSVAFIPAWDPFQGYWVLSQLGPEVIPVCTTRLRVSSIGKIFCPQPKSLAPCCPLNVALPLLFFLSFSFHYIALKVTARLVHSLTVPTCHLWLVIAGHVTLHNLSFMSSTCHKINTPRLVMPWLVRLVMKLDLFTQCSTKPFSLSLPRDRLSYTTWPGHIRLDRRSYTAWPKVMYAPR